MQFAFRLPAKPRRMALSGMPCRRTSRHAASRAGTGTGAALQTATRRCAILSDRRAIRSGRNNVQPRPLFAGTCPCWVRGGSLNASACWSVVCPLGRFRSRSSLAPRDRPCDVRRLASQMRYCVRCCSSARGPGRCVAHAPLRWSLCGNFGRSSPSCRRRHGPVVRPGSRPLPMRSTEEVQFA